MSSYRDPGPTKRQKLDTKTTVTKVPQFGVPLGKPGETSDGFKIPSIVKEKPEDNKPKSFSMDKEGRMIDEKGNIISLSRPTELKINQKSHKDIQARDLLKANKFGRVAGGELLAKRRFYDPTIEVSSQTKRDKRKHAALSFVQEGTYQKRGDIFRKKQAMEEFDQKEAQQQEESKGEPMDVDSGTVSQQKEDNGLIKKAVNLKPLDPIPECEWWDAFFLPDKLPNEAEVPKKFSTEEVKEADLHMDKLTNYIQHPVPLKNEYIESINSMVIPLYMLPKEIKRLKRLKKEEKQKDKQEKQRLGLLPPQETRLTMSNYMKVKAKEAIADPSKVEREVRAIVEKRVEDHLARNSQNKLTSQEKEAKMKRKHERDLKEECRVCLFKILDLTNNQHKFKVNMNAQQLHLGGFCFVADQNMASDLPNFVVVEGGMRCLKKFKRLMLRRINWNEKAHHKKADDSNTQQQQEDVEMDDTVKVSKDKKCFLVWEGIVKKRTMEKWRVVDLRSENEAKRLLGEKGCEHYWNMITTFQPQRAEGEEPEQLDKILA